jgi:flagellar protein FlgJ
MQALGALGADASPTMANAGRLPQVDPRTQLMYDAMRLGVMDPKDYLTATARDETPITVAPGAALVDRRTNKAIFTNPKAEDIPSEFRLWELSGAKARGIPFDQWDQSRRRASANNLSVNTGDNKFEAKAGEVIANQFAETYKQGQGAVRALGQVNRLDQLLQKTGGGFTPAVKMYAGQFGVNTAGLDDIQAAEAIIQSLIPQQRPVGSGTMSDKDVDLFRQSLPRLINQPGGNQKIISTMRGLYEYDQKLGKIASDALAGKISRERAMQLMNDVPNPLAYLTSGSDVHSQAEAIINRGRP